MFRVMKIIIISMCFVGTASADYDDWGWRHPHHHHAFYGYGNNPYYGGYAPAPQVYYPQPQVYIAPPAVNFYGVVPQVPVWGHRDRDGRW
jgi:hypothetical protein